MAPTYIADIGKYPPGNVSICRKSPKDLKFSWDKSLKDDCCYHRLCTAWYSFTLEIAKPGKHANILFFASKKSKQAEIFAFNRLLVNYNIHFFI